VSPDIPEWAKIRERTDPPKYREATITLLGRNGWITVDSKNINRTKTLEKEKRLRDNTSTSKLMPEWMLVRATASQPDAFRSSQPLALVRKDQKRMFLIDKVQPDKNVFSFMDFRHNVPNNDMVESEMKKSLSTSIKRICEWPEQINKQKYDIKVTSKVGSLI